MEKKKRKGKASLHAIMQCSNKSYPLVRGGKDYLILPTLIQLLSSLSLPIPLICTKAFNFAQSCFSSMKDVMSLVEYIGGKGERRPST
jgi:hypothetical protein